MASLVSKVNELIQKIDGFLENATHSGPFWPAEIDSNITTKPANLASQSTRKDLNNKLCP